MKLIKSEKVIDIMHKTLNHVDPRLMDHGIRVAYLMFNVLKPQNKHDTRQLRDICILGMLHDIGAYKTEEIDKMVIFETAGVWEHSIYGYLFLKYFSPLKELSPGILFHHADCHELAYLDPSHQELAQLISLCDRADVFLHSAKDINKFYRYIKRTRGKKFRPDIIDMFMAANIDLLKVNEGINSDKDFLETFFDTPLTQQEADEYLRMTVFSIDFRSSQTVIHTISAACISRIIAKLSALGEGDIEKITTGAMLHDLGKTGIPVSILESHERLSDAEMEIMKTHVDMTERIITGNVDEDIKQIAVHHHEKLNSTGYPGKVGASAISFNDRIVIIADIFSALCGARTYKDVYPKEKIIDILNDMSAQGLIDGDLVSLSIKNFDYITKELNDESKPVIEAYHRLNDDYARIRDSVKKSRFEGIVA